MSLKENLSSALRSVGLLSAAKELYGLFGGSVYRPEGEWIDRNFGDIADFTLILRCRLPKSRKTGEHRDVDEP